MSGQTTTDRPHGPAERDDPAASTLGRVLDQAEIDSLLGVGQPAAPADSMHRILNSGLFSFERLPVLDIVFDRLVRVMTTSLRNFTSDTVDVSIDSVVSLRFGEYLNTIALPTMIAVVKAEQWNSYGLVVVDSALIYSIVDVLLGGRRGTVPISIEGRAFTTIERTIVERLINVVLADLTCSFEPVCTVDFRFERLEVNPRFATISRLSNATVLASLRVDMDDRGGKLDVLLPYATLEPVRELLLQQFMGEKFGRDSIWEVHLVEELCATEIALDAVLDEQQMPLAEILALKAGSRIVLDARPGATVQIRCGAVPLFEARVGRKKERLAIRIEKIIPRSERERPHG